MHAVQQGAPGQTQLVSGVGLVAAVLAQAVEQQVALEPIHALAQAQRFAAFALGLFQIEVLRQQLAAFAEQYGSLDHTLELTHVAGEGVAGQMLQSGIAPAAGVALQQAAGGAGEVTREQQDVFVTLAQSRQLDGEMR